MILRIWIDESKPHGEWIEITDKDSLHSYICFNCGKSVDYRYRICPNCFAVMEDFDI